MAANNSMKELPAPIDLSHHFSQNAQSKRANPFKAFYRFFQIPGIGNFAGGMPNNHYFPFENLEAIAALPERFKPTSPKPVKPPAKTEDPDAGPRTGGSRIEVPMVSPDPNILSKIELKTALQYGDAHGLPPLYAWVKLFVSKHLHPNVPYKLGPEVLMTTGNTDGFAKTLEALMNPWREGIDPIEMRPGMLVEKFLYTPPAIRAQVYKANIVPLNMDSQGIMAAGSGGLEDVLENWDFSRGRRPHLLYTVTIGQNPTGGILSMRRRKEIYKICVKYDVIIIEDEPYWYLQFPSANPSKSEDQRNPSIAEMSLHDKEKAETSLSEEEPDRPSQRSSGFPFLDSLVPSFLSIDYQGRVVRLDTFSKTVAPGCRLGWITAQPELIERLYLSTQQTTQQPSGFVQSMIAQLILGTITPDPDSEQSSSNGLFNSLNIFGSPAPVEKQNGWGTEGWIRWLEGLRGNYERRMNTMCEILDANKTRSVERNVKHSSGAPRRSSWIHVRKQQIFEFDWPMGGMFAWVRLTLDTHPLAEEFELKDLAAAAWILLTREPYRVLASPGVLFSANEEIQMNEGYAMLRLCFAAANEPDIAPMTQRLVNGLHAFWDIERREDIEELLEESPFMQEALNTIAFPC